MNLRSSIWLPFDGHWETALTASEWQLRFSGPLPPTCATWLKPGPRATFVPCIHADGCGQPHRVHRLSDRKTWMARPEAPDCESFPLEPSAIETRQLNLDSLAHAIAHTLRLDSVALESLQNAPALFRLGHTGRNAVPSFLSVASGPAGVARAVASITLLQPGPVLIFVPLARHIPTATRATLRDRGGGLFALDEVVDLDARGQLIARKPLADLLPALARVRPTGVPRLLVPPGTPWSAIRIKIINGKTLIASHGSQTAQATAEQLNQVSRDNPDEFRPGWKTLVAFAAHGVLTGEEERLFPNEHDFKNRRAEVSAILRAFVNIEDNPIRDLRNVPDGNSAIRKGNRTHRSLRRGFCLIPSAQLITGVDKRVGHLDDLPSEDPENQDSADSYPGRTPENSDES